MISFLNEIHDWVNIILKRQENKNIKTAEASACLQESITETQIYFGRLSRKEGRDLKIESNLARLWGKAALKIREAVKKDKGVTFSHRCYVFSKYWAKPTFSPETKIEKFETLLDDIFIRQIIENQMTSSIYISGEFEYKSVSEEIMKEQKLVLGLTDRSYSLIIDYLKEFIDVESLIGRPTGGFIEGKILFLSDKYLLESEEIKKNAKRDIISFISYFEGAKIKDIEKAFLPLSIETIEIIINEMLKDKTIQSTKVNGVIHYYVISSC